MAKKNKDAELELPKQPAPAERGPTGDNRMREFMAAGGGLKRVARFDLLEAEFTGLAEADLPLFFETLSIHVRGWMIVSRLFGIADVIPKPDASPDDLRTWPREELLAELGLGAKELREELDRLRGVWNGTRKSAGGTPTGAAGTAALPGTGELVFAESAALERFDLLDKVTRKEMPWMAQRVDALLPILNNAQAGELTRMLLLTELDLRRLHDRMSKSSKEIIESDGTDEKSIARRRSLENEYEDLFKKRTKLMEAYEKQVERIDAITPFMKLAAGSMGSRAVFSDATEYYKAFSLDPENKSLDGNWTLAEMAVLHRTSQQAPEPQYRADFTVYWTQAFAHLWDPAWEGKFKPRKMKMIREAYTAAAAAIANAPGQTLTDLESDDPVAGEYREE